MLIDELIKQNELFEIFINLVKIPSPSMSEQNVAKFIELKHFETLYTGNILRRTKNDVTSMDVAMPEVLQPNVEIYKKEVKKALN